MVSPVLTRPSAPAARPVVPPHSLAAAPTVRRWSLRRTHVVVGTGAAAVAVWVGVTAPSVSPVAPPVPATATSTTAAAADPPPDVTAVVPPVPAAVDGPRGARGR